MPKSWLSSAFRSLRHQPLVIPKLGHPVARVSAANEEHDGGEGEAPVVVHARRQLVQVQELVLFRIGLRQPAVAIFEP